MLLKARADCWKKKCGTLLPPDILRTLFFFLILPHRLYIVGGENVDISFKSCLLLAVFMLDSCLSSQPDLKRYFYKNGLACMHCNHPSEV